ncbi:MAG: B12-binding domain-containing radical SAM protein [Elusimicrobia bacterium]|nr:B12-binding domain-containing radical SAM protein [Elusimicrobiota bacterium]
MKILLIQPNPRKFIPYTCSSVPLGLLYVSAALRQAGRGEIMLVDARVQNLNHKELSARLKDFSPDVAGISGLSTEAQEVHELAGLVKKTAAGCKVVVGGPYATTSPEAVIQDPHIDFAVIGEGERTICELVGALERASPVSGIDGLAFKNEGEPVVNPRLTTIDEIDSIPYPAWDLIEAENYFNLWARHSENPFPASDRIVPVFTSRGCPFGCIYCHNIFGKKLRLRSVRNVIREIEFLIERYGAGEIEIVDDIFNLDLARAKQICDEIISRGLNIKLSFPNGLRIDRMDEELLVKLKKAGTHLIFYAIESASPKVQKQIMKNIDLEKAARIVRQTARQGIVTGGFFMLGFPDETKEEMLETIRFAKELPFHLASFFYVTPRPNTPIQALLKKKGVDLEKIPLLDYFRFSSNYSAVPDEELQRLIKRANSEFYRRPSQLLRLWKALPNKKYILKALLRAFIMRKYA